ncbi:MAG: BlaI/MecI/CopY family transcriptional regulator [Gemmatimonadetes bacterium]|nr:BlaI/MecI/CopY family transcriptional regulator [Gemmatimonadota bacterium]MBI2537979.1 BlaI/MecI/CopY family transcriptional regulator [Gemmatimonadota bacterium]MBI2615708.1 BlaI/MecI/CopY family transcriptional regulator [Gemmatimonadota bacterium]
MHLTSRELDVMAVLWRRGSATVSEVMDELEQRLAYTTVLTVLRGLEAKGAVRHEEEGRAYRYRPRIAASRVGDTRLDRLLEQVYQGSRELLLARLVADRAISREELKRLRRLVDERLKEADR